MQLSVSAPKKGIVTSESFGHTVRYAVAGFDKSWIFGRDHLFRAYTTRWGQLPVVKASFPAGTGAETA